MSNRSRNRKPRNPRIDTLLLAKYGIISPTRLEEGMTVMTPIAELTPDDKEDLLEFAQFLMAPERAHDLDFLLEEEPTDATLHDEP